MAALFVIALACLLFASSIVTLLIAAWMGLRAKGNDRGAVHAADDRRIGSARP